CFSSDGPSALRPGTVRVVPSRNRYAATMELFGECPVEGTGGRAATPPRAQTRSTGSRRDFRRPPFARHADRRRGAMPVVETFVEVHSPVSAVYRQWLNFEDYPRFMEGVEKVEELDDGRIHWRATHAGLTLEWDAEIVENVPDRRIA